MKKLLITFALIIAIVALLPIVGNSVTQDVIKKEVTVLSLNGLTIEKETTDSPYLKTKKHYELLIADGVKFVKHLNRKSNTKFPAYFPTLTDGLKLGVDVEYSNFPLSSNVEVDIYLLSLPTTMMQELKSEDVDFYLYIEKLLYSRAILNHVSYNVSTGEFQGFMKNLDEEYSFTDGTKLIFKIKEATYRGKGSLAVPNNLHSKISNITFNVETPSESLSFILSDIDTSSTFESLSTYDSMLKLKNFSLTIQESASGTTEVNIEDLKMNMSSNTRGDKAEFHSKSSIKNLKISSFVSHLVASELNYDISIDGVDKDAYEKFSRLISQGNTLYSTTLEQELQASITQLLSRGLTLKLANLSIQKIGIENKEPIEGFNIMAKMTLKEDADLASKLISSPLAWSQNMTLTSSLEFSKAFYSIAVEKLPLLGLARSIAREDANVLTFDIKLNSNKLIINDKVLN